MILNGPAVLLTGSQAARLDVVLRAWIRDRQRLGGGGLVHEELLDTASDISAVAKSFRQTAQANAECGNAEPPGLDVGAVSDESDRVVTTAEAAKALAVSERRIRGLAAEGALNARKRCPSGPWLIEVGSVQELAARRVNR